MKKLKLFVKENWPIITLLLVLLVMHIMTIRELGFGYTLNSDDASYIKSGVVFLESLTIKSQVLFNRKM